VARSPLQVASVWWLFLLQVGRHPIQLATHNSKANPTAQFGGLVVHAHASCHPLAMPLCNYCKLHASVHLLHTSCHCAVTAHECHLTIVQLLHTSCHLCRNCTPYAICATNACLMLLLCYECTPHAMNTSCHEETIKIMIMHARTPFACNRPKHSIIAVDPVHSA
jgi:hypothetical protein